MRMPSILSWQGGCALLLLLAACSDAVDPGTELTAAEGLEAGLATADEVEAMTDAIGAGGEMDVFAASSGSQAAFNPVLVPPPFPTGCATVSDETDTDGDGTPDQAVFTFALPACHFTNYRGGSVDLTGTVTVSDPTPTAADLNRRVDLDAFTFAAMNAVATRSYTAVRSGSRTLTGSSSGATLTNTITTVRTWNSQPAVTVTHNLQAQFSPISQPPLPPDVQHVSGTLNLTGTLTWSREGRSRVFTVTTITPLLYDATCTGPRRARISAGELHWTLPSGTYVKTVWTACGVPPTREVVSAA